MFSSSLVGFQMENGEINGLNGEDEEQASGINKIENLSSELFETRKERDMLLEEIDLLKQEHDINRNIERVNLINDGSNTTEKNYENKLLKEEKEKMKEEINTLTIALNEDLKRNPENQERQFTQLLNQVKELKEENTQLRNRLNAKDTIENKVSFIYFSFVVVVFYLSRK